LLYLPGAHGEHKGTTDHVATRFSLAERTAPIVRLKSPSTAMLAVDIDRIAQSFFGVVQIGNRRLFSIMASSISLLLIAVFGAFFGVASLFVYLFTPPRHFPRNIPTIPFYYALLPLYFDVDQAENYRRYLKEPLAKYGAVKIFFASQWNILVS
jgi:hypothetical protein